MRNARYAGCLESGFLGVAVAAVCLMTICRALPAQSDHISAHNVTWTTLGQNENDSMPIGNGDLAANVWTEQNGDVVLLVAKSDAWTELGKLVKLGRIRISCTPSPFAGMPGFRQVLHLEDGSLEISNGSDRLRVWADANHPAIHIETKFEHPVAMRAKLEVWRTADHPYDELSPDKGGLFEFGGHAVPIAFEADRVVPAAGNRVEWYHFNRESVYPLTLEQEHLASLAKKYPDPLLHRCFGAALVGPGWKSEDDRTLQSPAARSERLDLIALTEPNVPAPQEWQSRMDALVRHVSSLPLASDFAAHRHWWHDFWQRSWIDVSGSADAEKVAQGYAMQRYMMAASSRGAFPVKFNGGLFTVGHDVPGNVESTPANHDPDFRAWGNSFWNQNERHLYWPLIASGDFDLLRPWFQMYTHALPLVKDRTRLYFHHGGAAFIETMLFWGLPNVSDFGWNNTSNEVQSRYMRYHTQGALEVLAQMIDEYAITQDRGFAKDSIVPFAEATVEYYALHWPRDEHGTIRMAPSQSIETYQLDAVNPTPDIAALRSIVPRLIALPVEVAPGSDRAQWTKLETELPQIPIGKTAHGKLPPLGVGDPDGTPVILPAEKYGKPRNSENPELYTVFPYRIYDLGKPDLELAKNTFAARAYPGDTCWRQDGMEAALLGFTSIAKKAAVDEFTQYGDERFLWFWRPGNDWIPDLDNGGAGMSTLQLMLMQTDGKKIRLLPAWPQDWTADFRLHASYNTLVQGHVTNGKITQLTVTPHSRAKDVELSTDHR
jgi:hypothetical protein